MNCLRWKTKAFFSCFNNFTYLEDQRGLSFVPNAENVNNGADFYGLEGSASWLLHEHPDGLAIFELRVVGDVMRGRRRSELLVEVSQWKAQQSVFCLLAKPVVEIEKELFFNVLIDFNLHRTDLDIDGFPVALYHKSHFFSWGL